jgi:hypothetical protein
VDNGTNVCDVQDDKQFKQLGGDARTARRSTSTSRCYARGIAGTIFEVE